MNSQYQEHCRKMKFISNCNRYIGAPDPKQVITAWLETIIIKHFSKKFSHDKRSILTWKELTNTNQYVRKYREIDGLFTSSDGLIYIEVKASLSKSSYRRGKTQLNENSKLLMSIDPNIKAILTMADCRCYDPTFGYAKEFIDEENISSEIYKNIEGLKYPDSFDGSSKWLWLLSEVNVAELAKIYGHPQEWLGPAAEGTRAGESAAQAIERHGVSERRVCRILSQPRGTRSYWPILRWFRCESKRSRCIHSYCWEAAGWLPQAVRLSKTIIVWLQQDIDNWVMEKYSQVRYGISAASEAPLGIGNTDDKTWESTNFRGLNSGQNRGNVLVD